MSETEVFPLFDYISTVSGGGYFGASVSTTMRSARASIDSRQKSSTETKHEEFVVGEDPWTTGYRWIVRPTRYLREMTSWLSEQDRWVNLSDGGHIENLGVFELLRRKCRLVVVGDGEADPDLSFPSLTLVLQAAKARLNTRVEWSQDSIHLWEKTESNSTADRPHSGLGRIWYPGDETPAYIIYLKSSIKGDEPSEVKGYARKHEAFPHESTSDQFFDPSQFDAYRDLGIHIARSALSQIGLEWNGDGADNPTVDAICKRVDASIG